LPNLTLEGGEDCGLVSLLFLEIVDYLSKRPVALKGRGKGLVGSRGGWGGRKEMYLIEISNINLVEASVASASVKCGEAGLVRRGRRSPSTSPSTRKHAEDGSDVKAL
jgi:hypothetical protein